MSLGIGARLSAVSGRDWDWRKWPVGGEHVHWGVAEAVLVLLGTQSLQILWFGAMSSLIWDGDPPPTASRAAWTIWVLSFGIWAGYFLGPFFMNRVTGSGPMVDFVLRASRRQIAAAVVIGAVAQLVLLPALYYPLLRVVDGDPGRSAKELAATVDTPLETFFFFGAAIVIAPVVEEWFYRGMLLPALSRRFGPAVGILGSTVAFTLIHVRPIMFPGIFTIGLLLALLTFVTGRLGPAIVAHMTFNAITAISLVYFQ